MCVYETVLVGGVGMSPAVLTETIWALAHEKTPVIPGLVVAVTTKPGKELIQSKLLKSGVWSGLVKALEKEGFDVGGKLRFGADETIRVLGDGTNDYADITTPEESMHCADSILNVLRQYTEDPNKLVVTSIAGGRKTLSALMLACMSLLGREQDRVCHVLANDEYIFANKDFCFPQNKREAEEAQISLSDIPFIRVRGWYEQESGKLPASYSHMVSLFRQAAPEAVVYPKVVLDRIAGTVEVDGSQIKVSPLEFLLLLALVENFLLDRRAFEDWDVVKTEINDLMAEKFPFDCGWHEKALGTNYTKKRWSAVASDLRLNKFGGKSYASALVPGPGERIVYPPEKISVRTS
jgi:CRISPR-associated protein (TIGR02584 family)